MDDRMPVNQAAQRFATKKRVSFMEARRVLVSALLLGETAAFCDSYWVSAQMIDPPNVSVTLPRAEGLIPSGFWRANHALDYKAGPHRPEVGGYGSWELGSFDYTQALTCDAAATRFPDVARDLGQYGTARVAVSLTVTDVEMHFADVDLLCSRTDWKSLRARAERATKIKLGKKSDLNALLARLIADILPAEDLESFQSSAYVLSRLSALREGITEDAAIGDPMMKSFSELVAKAVTTRTFRQGPPI